MVYQKTAIQLGSSTLTSIVDPITKGSSFVMNLVEDGATAAHAFATFSGATNELTLQTSGGAKGTLNANVSAPQITTATGSVTDGTNTLTLEPSTLQFDSNATIASSGTLTVESLLISGAEISNANLVLSGSTNIHLNSAEVIFGNNVDTGGKISSSKTSVNGTEVGVMTIDPSPDDNRGSLVIKGDLTVTGTTTTVNSSEITMADAILELNGGNIAADSGLRVNREGTTAVEFLWDESESHWTVGSESIKAASFIGVASDVANLNSFTTDHLNEGSNNLYYTDARVDSRLTSALSGLSTSDISEGSNLYYTDTRARAAISATDAGGDGSLVYNQSTGVITYTGPSATEVRAHFTAGTGVTITNGAVAIGQSVGTTDNVRFNSVTANLTGNVTGTVTGTVSDLSNHDTGDLSEGSNLYYTDTRARGAVSVNDAGGDGSLAYNSSTGVITYTGPSATEVRAHLSVGHGLTYSGGEYSLGKSLDTYTVSANQTNLRKDLQTLLTGGTSPFSNPVNGGAATVYVSYGDKLTNPGTVNNLCMGVYHAIVIGGAVNVVSQLEGHDSTGNLKLHLDGTEIVVDNGLAVAATLTFRVVVQFDNTDHL